MPSYNNYMAVNPYQQTFTNQPTQAVTDDIIFVAGEAGAKQYPVAYRHVATLFDSTPDSNVFWLKSGDPMQPMRTFDYQERLQPQISTQQSKELDDLRKEFVNVHKTVEELKALVASLAKPLNDLLGDSGAKEEQT